MVTITWILDTVLKYLKRGMTVIFTNYWLTIAGSIMLGLFLSLLLARKMQKKSYVFKREAPWVYHVVMMVLLPSLSIWVLLRMRGYSILYIIAGVMICRMALFSVWNLYKYKWIGVVGADLTLICNTILMNVWIYNLIRRTFDEIMEYNAAGIYSLLATSDMWMYYGWLMSVCTCVLITVNAAFYARRYYLFFPGEIKGVSHCSKCGHPVFKGEHSCPACGTKVEEAITEGPEGMLMGDALYCVKCGTPLRKGICHNCGIEYTKDNLLEELTDQISEAGTRLAAYLLFLALAIVPSLMSKADRLIYGSAQINNEYMGRLREYVADHTVAQDDAWMEDYSQKYQALMVKNTEWIEVSYKQVTHNNLVFYTIYSDAAFNQCTVMEEINAEIYMSAAGQQISEEALQSQLRFYDKCIEDMGDAVVAGFSSTAGDNILTKFGNIVLSGIRYWYARMPEYGLGIFMIIAGIVSAVFLIVDVMKDEELKDVKWYLKIPVWIINSLSGSTKEEFAASREYIYERWRKLVMIGVLCAVFAVAGFVIPKFFKTSDDRVHDYMAECRVILLDNGLEQDVCVNELMHYSRGITDDDLKLMLETFYLHIERDREYLAITDIPEEYTEFDRRMDRLCQEDIEIVSGMIETLNTGFRPSREKCSELVHLRLDKYGDLVAGYLNYVMNLAKEMTLGD